MNRKDIQKYKTGFTLIELLVAISILSISILAAYTAVSNNIKGQTFAEDQVVAYYLADEGIESIRNIRDQNNITNIVNQSNGGSQVSWLSGINPTCVGTACAVDSPLLTITACPGDASTCPYLNMNTASGLYGYTGGSGVGNQTTVVSQTVSENGTASLTCSSGTIQSYTSMYGSNTAGSCPVSCGTCSIGSNSCSVTYNNALCGDCNSGYVKNGDLSLTCGTSGGGGTWVQTQFKRGISVQIISATEIKVTCTVSWVTNGVAKSYVLTENMLEWE